MKIFETILWKLGKSIHGLSCRYHLLMIKRNPNISIGKNVFIHPSAKLETPHGGKIVIGDGTQIMHGVLIITWGGDIELGKHCIVSPYAIIYGNGGVKIGNFVGIAGHSMIVPDNHKYADIDIPIFQQGTEALGINIEDNVWIGHACSILPSVNLGKGAIVAAGSVVTKKVEPNAIVAGVPAKLLKSRKADG